MNGATALDCENTISSPNSTNTMTMGRSQYFFSAIRNCQNSLSTRLFAISPLVHLREVIGATVPLRVRRPALPSITPALQRIAANEPPDERDGRQHDRKRDREDDASVHPSERHSEAPPQLAGVIQGRWRQRPTNDQHRTDAARPLRNCDPVAPHRESGDQQQDS